MSEINTSRPLSVERSSSGGEDKPQEGTDNNEKQMALAIVQSIGPTTTVLIRGSPLTGVPVKKTGKGQCQLAPVEGEAGMSAP